MEILNIDVYQTAVLVLSGICLCCVLFGGLIRPLEEVVVPATRQEKKESCFKELDFRFGQRISLDIGFMTFGFMRRFVCLVLTFRRISTLFFHYITTSLMKSFISKYQKHLRVNTQEMTV